VTARKEAAAAAECPACEGWGFERGTSPMRRCASCDGRGRPLPTNETRFLGIDQEKSNG